jgi:hypothetical protein
VNSLRNNRGLYIIPLALIALAALALSQLACGGGGGGSKPALISGVVRDADANPLGGGDTSLFLNVDGSSVGHPLMSGVFSSLTVQSSITELPILGISAGGEVFFKRLQKGVDFQELATDGTENHLGNIDLVRQGSLSTGYTAFLDDDFSSAMTAFQQVSGNTGADPVLRSFAYVMQGFTEMYSTGNGNAATTHFDNALGIFELASAHAGKGGAQLALGGSTGQSGPLQQAESDLDAALQIDGNFSFLKGLIQKNDVRAGIAMARFLRGEHVTARVLAQEILADGSNLRGDSEDLLNDILLHISLGG